MDLKDKQECALLQAKALLLNMTLTEKLGQLSQFGTSIYSDEEHYYEDHFTEGKIGSYLTIKGAAKTNRIQKMVIEESRLSIPVLFADDVIHGYKTTFPTPLALSCSWEPELAKRSSAVAAKEAYSDGLKWTFAPMVDIARDPRWGRIMEGYGEDPYLCSIFGEASVKGFQGDYIGEKDHILACIKHYVAYGACIGGRDYNSVDISLQTLHDVYLPSFQAGIKAGAATIMSAFNDVNGVPCTANKYLLRDVLRDKFFFDGVVISDACAIGELINHGYCEDDEDSAGKAFSSGVDIVMAGDLYNDYLPKQMGKGVVRIEMIDDAVLRILKLKYLLGLFETPFVDEEVGCCFFAPSHLETAHDCAKRSIVLLENKKEILPINNMVKHIAVIGPLADDKRHVLGGWACLSDPSHTVSILDGVKEAAQKDTKVTTARGCTIDGDDTTGFVEACRVAEKAELVIVVVGEDCGMSGEAQSRSDISLPGVQEQLIMCLAKLGKPLVVLVSSGRPLVLTNIKDKVDALLMIWQLGTETGRGVADVLFGKYNPSGRLTTSFPYSVGQLPVYYNYFSTGRPARGNTPFEAKYRDAPIQPVYPFGYGLSYTNFSYSDLILSSTEMDAEGEINIQCKITNIGTYDGEEVVQLYVRDLIGSRVRPVKELKGFKKVFVSKGKSVTVTFCLKAEQLSFHNNEMQLVTECGNFKLWVAKNSSENGLEAAFRLIL